MKKPPIFLDLPPPNLTVTTEKTTRCKLIIKYGGRMIGCTTNKDAITAANTTGGDDPSTGLQQSPLESTMTPKRRKKNNAEPGRDQSHTPWIAPSLPPTLHDLVETREKLMHNFKTSVDKIKHKVLSKGDNKELAEPTPPPVVTAAITGGSPNGLKINESIDDTGVNIWEGRTKSRSCNKKERPPFRFLLTEAKIEEDFMKMTMDKNWPPQKQKKRSKDLQK